MVELSIVLKEIESLKKNLLLNGVVTSGQHHSPTFEKELKKNFSKEGRKLM